MTNFKIGDKLLVKKGHGTADFADGSIVECVDFGYGYVYVTGKNGQRSGGWDTTRFELAKKRTPKFSAGSVVRCISAMLTASLKQNGVYVVESSSYDPSLGEGPVVELEGIPGIKFYEDRFVAVKPLTASPKEGDKLRIIDLGGALRDQGYQLGDIVTASKHSGGGFVYLSEPRQQGLNGFFNHRFELAEAAPQPKKLELAPKVRWAKGTKLRATVRFGSYRVGDVVVLSKDNTFDDSFLDVEGGAGLYYECDFAPAGSPKVGDKLRVVKAYAGWLDLGDIVTCTNVGPGTTCAKVKHGYSGGFSSDHFELVASNTPVTPKPEEKGPKLPSKLYLVQDGIDLEVVEEEDLKDFAAQPR